MTLGRDVTFPCEVFAGRNTAQGVASGSLLDSRTDDTDQPVSCDSSRVMEDLIIMRVLQTNCMYLPM